MDFKDTGRPIESPVRFLSDLLLSGSFIGEHKNSWRSIKYGLYEMFVDNCKKKENCKHVVHKTEFSFLIGPFFFRRDIKQNILS